jgi:hypothetical protein
MAETKAAGGSGTGPQAEASTKREANMKVKIDVNGKTVTATLIDSKTTRDFVSLLPLTLKMEDLFGREKFGHLPREISGEGSRTRTYEVGQIVYWSPGPDVAIYYRRDREEIPAPGIIVLGKLDSGAATFDRPGPLRVTIEAMK